MAGLLSAEELVELLLRPADRSLGERPGVDPDNEGIKTLVFTLCNEFIVRISSVMNNLARTPGSNDAVCDWY